MQYYTFLNQKRYFQVSILARCKNWLETKPPETEIEGSILALSNKLKRTSSADEIEEIKQTIKLLNDVGKEAVGASDEDISSIAEQEFMWDSSGLSGTEEAINPSLLGELESAGLIRRGVR